MGAKPPRQRRIGEGDFVEALPGRVIVRFCFWRTSSHWNTEALGKHLSEMPVESGSERRRPRMGPRRLRAKAEMGENQPPGSDTRREERSAPGLGGAKRSSGSAVFKKAKAGTHLTH